MSLATPSGDYYDFVPRPGSRLAFGLGDVSGKGTGAALIMTVLWATVRAWAEQEGEIVSIITQTNRVMCQTPGHAFVTFFLGDLNLDSGELHYVNAGHLPPVLCRLRTREAVRLEDGGTVLGLFESPTFQVGRSRLDRGDVLVAFTDGITESWGEGGVEFGEERVVEVVRSNAQLASQDLIDTILREVDRHTRGARPTDDRTLVVLKRK